MNFKSPKQFAETINSAVVDQMPKPEAAPLTEAQKERMARIKTAMNRAARERRKAAQA